ncbi:MAG: ATP-binding protein [Paracoccaceae bacterium]
MNLPRSTYYCRPAAKAEGMTDIELPAIIEDIQDELPCYGYRRVTHELRRHGLVVNHKKAARVMLVAGLEDPLHQPSIRSSSAFPTLHRNVSVQRRRTENAPQGCKRIFSYTKRISFHNLTLRFEFKRYERVHFPVAARSPDCGPTDEASMLRTLNTFAVNLIQIPSVEDLFWYVAQNVVGRLSFVDCVIYQADDEQTTLKQVAAWGEKNPFGRSIVNPLVIPFGSGITGQVAQTTKAIIVDDLLKDQNYIPDTQPARSEICVPLVFCGRVVGVIDCEHPDPNAFGEAELEILSTVAAMTGAKLELLAEAQRSAQRYRDLVASHSQLTQEISIRKALEAKLFEARRLEAIGKLTGRFAHEFNNLLTVILGNLEFLEADITSLDATHFLGEAKTAAKTGAQLMRDMLAFAQRTRLVPVVMDLNELISRFCATNDPNVPDRIEVLLADGLWQISADCKAMESVVLNLVENARDATAAGGKIVIQTQNVIHNLLDNPLLNTELLPGRYVRLNVTDTGVGIPHDRLPHIFDPFYTSKPVGAGTGLGLSIVRGFTQQSGGSVTVIAEVGRETTFQLNFPAVT